MIKKYSVLTGIVISLILILIAIAVYPGGTMFNEYTTGFSWTKNFMSNLFGTRALNGTENPSRIWACLAMIVLPLTYALFFFNVAKKIPEKNAGYILKYASVANILFTFLTITALHDSMLIISTTLFWTCLLITSIFVLKTKLHLFKFFCIISLVVFYYSVYLWGISDWHLLPIMQKVNFASSTLLILGLEYFTKKEDFAQIKSRAHQKLATNR
ncbi:MAG: hypothetical protein V4456_11245 [Bacteroidota bacterium]